MKKNYLFYFVGLLLCGTTNAQIITGSMTAGPVSFNPCHSIVTTNPFWTSATQVLYSACSDVKVGIGTSNPTHSLHVPLNARFGDAKIDYSMAIGSEVSSFSKLLIRNPTQDAAIEIQQTGNNKEYQKLLLFSYSHPTTEILKAYNSQTGVVSYLFEASGKMTVSNGVQKIFQLESNGLLRVRNVRVDTESWPDYVFKVGYRLMPLYEVERFINEKGHLPNIPSEQEIITDGIDVAEMNIKLLEKIEELTLYLIDQEKQILELKKQIAILNEK